MHKSWGLAAAAIAWVAVAATKMVFQTLSPATHPVVVAVVVVMMPAARKQAPPAGSL